MAQRPTASAQTLLTTSIRRAGPRGGVTSLAHYGPCAAGVTSLWMISFPTTPGQVPGRGATADHPPRLIHQLRDQQGRALRRLVDDRVDRGHGVGTTARSRRTSSALSPAPRTGRLRTLEGVARVAFGEVHPDEEPEVARQAGDPGPDRRRGRLPPEVRPVRPGEDVARGDEFRGAHPQEERPEHPGVALDRPAGPERRSFSARKA